MTIAKRLVLLLALPLLALVGIAAVARLHLSAIEDRSKFVAKSQIPSLAMLGNISRSYAEMRVNVRSYLLAPDPAGQGRAAALFEEDEAEVNRLLQEYGDHLISDDRDRRLYDEFRAHIRDWVAGARQAMELSARGKPAEATAVLDGSALQSAVRLGNISREWIAHNEQLASDAAAATLANIQDARRKMLVTDSSVVLATALLGFLTFQKDELVAQQETLLAQQQELTSRNEQLQAAMQKAEEATKAKSVFLEAAVD